MGCDIHLYTERYYADKGKWFCRDSFQINPYWDNGDDLIERLDHVPIYDMRNYELFAELADVRNYRNKPSISEPRGIPDDVSDIVRARYDYEKEYCHSFSWLTAKELFKWASEHPTTQYSGMVSKEEAMLLDRFGAIPSSWCRYTNEDGAVFREWEVPGSAIQPLVDAVKDKIVDEFWIFSEGYKREEGILAHAEEFRIVFWFDS